MSIFKGKIKWKYRVEWADRYTLYPSGYQPELNEQMYFKDGDKNFAIFGDGSTLLDDLPKIYLDNLKKPTIFNYNSDTTHTTNQNTNIDQILCDCSSGNINLTLTTDGFEGKTLKIIRLGSGVLRINGVLASKACEYVYASGAYVKVWQQYEEIVLFDSPQGISSGENIALIGYTTNDFVSILGISFSNDWNLYLETEIHKNKDSNSSSYGTNMIMTLKKLDASTVRFTGSVSSGSFKLYVLKGILQ